MTKEIRSLEIWSPLPPQPSGVADYVAEQLEELAKTFVLTLVVENPERTESGLRAQYRVVSPSESDSNVLRLYHVGNSPLHRYVYDEAIRTPGVVVLHEWNLHELLLGFAVTDNDFTEYRKKMRREHGERGSIAAETIAVALGGKHWPALFPLNAEILSRSLAVVTLSESTAARVADRDPGGRLLHLPHHAALFANAENRADARGRLGFNAADHIVLAPGLGTASKALDAARAAVDAIRTHVPGVRLVTAGGDERGDATVADDSVRHLGRVDLRTLGDALLTADVVLALRFPSRGEVSGVLMRALAAGRAIVVSVGSTADEDLPAGVVARVNPGPNEIRELSAVLEFLLTNDDARRRMERLARATADARPAEALTKGLSAFLLEIGNERAALEARIAERVLRGAHVAPYVKNELEALAANLGLAHLPSNVFEKLSRFQ